MISQRNRQHLICHFSTVHPIFDVRIVYRECRSLANHGYDVTLIIPSEGKTVDGVAVIPIKRFENKFFRVLFGWVALVPHFLRKKYDIYHFHDPELIPIGLVLNLIGKRVIFDMHENVAMQIKNKDWLPFNGVFSRVYRLIDFLVARNLNIIFAETSYKTYFGDRIKKESIDLLNMPNKLFFENFVKLDRRENPNHVFYIGGVSENRGIMEVLQALTQLKNRSVPFFFHCIGRIEGSVLERIEQLDGYKSIEEHVKFYGPMNLEEGYQIASGCKIGLAVLRPIPNYLESYPTKIFEYMAIGLPVITSNFPLYKSVVEKHMCGICVNPENVDEISNAMQAIFQKSTRSREFGVNGLKAVEEEYSWQIEEEKLFKFYAKLLSNG